MAKITLITDRLVKVSESAEYVKNHILHNRLFITLNDTTTKKQIHINKNSIATIE